MIQLINLGKTYKNGHTALSSINLKIDEGEMVFITGSSGAGKTTLLKLLIMIERATQGNIIINGNNINHMSRKEIAKIRRKIGLIFQTPHLISSRTIYENTALPLIIDGYKPREIKRRPRAALDKVNLLSKEKYLPIEL